MPVNCLFVVLAAFLFAPSDVSATELSSDSAKQERITQIAERIGTFSLVVQSGDDVLYQFGNVETPKPVRSIRKAILSTLVFQHLDAIDLNATLDELGIDDAPIPLTPLQKTAKLIHLLKSRSGIGHLSGSQNAIMDRLVAERLGDREHEPGSVWCYNNWDYNALTSIFEQETGLSIEEAFVSGIAKPLGITDFDVFYRRYPELSRFPKAGFRFSALDLAKFGVLMSQRGVWQGEQLVPAAWIDKIATDFSVTAVPPRDRYGHGYLWWIPVDDYAGGIPKGTYLATGAKGQRLLVIPDWNLVVSHMTDTDVPIDQVTAVSAREFEELVTAVLE